MGFRLFGTHVGKVVGLSMGKVLVLEDRLVTELVEVL